MPMFPANSSEAAPRRRIVILVYPGVTLLDAAGPAQVFSAADEVGPEGLPAYEVILASGTGALGPQRGVGIRLA